MPADLSMFSEPPRKGSSCLVGLLLEQLDDKLAQDLRKIMADPTTRWFRVEEHSEAYFGTEIPAATASRHARGGCKCPR